MDMVLDSRFAVGAATIMPSLESANEDGNEDRSLKMLLSFIELNALVWDYHG